MKPTGARETTDCAAHAAVAHVWQVGQVADAAATVVGRVECGG